ncbi:PH domain-containing protein [Cutibacterium equinum]|uniref:PH domain-containing protein n=1 Tax=Cutibacterium equinum TaxID=3016342 RepID=A0ABY7QWS4_9ACTN|nr:PH domain-containing protein [Cutibacterium equinum]WCC79509.1 PH domain-containing protein [Cutibacterium equinum]
MRPPIIISSHRGRIGVGIVLAAIVVLTILDLIRSGLAGLTNLPVLLLFVWLVWIIWGVAEIRINDDGVTVVNQFRIWEVPWDRITEVTGRWGLSLTAERRPDAEGARKPRTISAWAAPARGTATAMKGTADHLPQVIIGSEVPMRWSLDSHATARLIETERIERRPVGKAAATQAKPESTSDHQKSTRATPHDAEIRVHPNWLTICVTVVLVAAAIII